MGYAESKRRNEMSRQDGKPTEKMLRYAESLAHRLEEDCPWWGRCESFAGANIVGFPATPTFDEVSEYISDAKKRVEAMHDESESWIGAAELDAIDARGDW